MLELVTVGSGSGKSAYAESRICEWNRQDPKPLFYIATMYPYGEETEKKIERHRMLVIGALIIISCLSVSCGQTTDILLETCRKIRRSVIAHHKTDF